MQPISINFVTKTIILTKSFNEAAKNPFSDEYAALTELVKEHPDMNVIVRSYRRSQANENKGLTYDYMRRFIRTLDIDNLVSFEMAIKHFEEFGYSSTTLYIHVKDWFLEHYPHHKEMIIDSAPQKRSEAIKAA